MRRGTTYRSLLKKTLFNDWYLPSRDELHKIKLELYDYGVGTYEPISYWSSSQELPEYAYVENFVAGFQAAESKSYLDKFMPVRDFISSEVFALRSIGPAGGYIFWSVDNGDGTYTYYEATKRHMIPNKWSNVITSVSSTSTLIGTGKSNTLKIIAQVGHILSAANDCKNLRTYN